MTIEETARRFDGVGSSEVFPCPACGQFVNDADGKKYGKVGKRYGNPFIQESRDYAIWKARNRKKDGDWMALPLFASEEREVERLRNVYVGVPLRFAQWWVLGERETDVVPITLTPTKDEEEVIARWMKRGFTYADCLRWIEGQRYDPMQDDAFLERVDKELLKAAFRNSQPEPIFHAEFKARK